MFDIITSILSALGGFGVFSVRARKTGIGRNPRTGTEVSITPGKAVRFKPGKELRERVDAMVGRPILDD